MPLHVTDRMQQYSEEHAEFCKEAGFRGRSFVGGEWQCTRLYCNVRACAAAYCTSTSVQRHAVKGVWLPQSVLARGLHALLPPIEVVKQSYCNADPEQPREWEARPVAA